MLKKLIKMSVIMSLLATSVTAFAQNSGKAEYPRYSFWSNWSVGVSADATWEMGQHGYAVHDNFASMWRRSLNVGGSLMFMHKQNHMINTRYRLTMPTGWAANADNDGILMTRYWTLTADVMLSLTDWIKGYDPERMHSWYVLAGAGLYVANWPLDKDDLQLTRNGRNGHVTPELNFGLGYRLNFCEHSGFFVEANLLANDIPNPTKEFADWPGVNGELRIGYLYNFGITAADQNIAAQKSMVTTENFGALNSQVADLEKQVADSKNAEKKLQRRINELENQLAEAMRNQGNKVNTAAADSLQNIINQIKADQLNYYAMPFSVQYDVNEWQVSDEEIDKVKAVARVMKDNSNVKIRVVGFADYTGSDAYNMKLSERRANEVKRLLKSYGVAEDRIEVDYKGKNAPFGDAQYALNRRVSFYRVIE